MIRTLLSALALCVLGACVTTQEFERGLDRWVGKPIDRVVEKLGPPHGSHKKQNGDTHYQWSLTRTHISPGTTMVRPAIMEKYPPRL